MREKKARDETYNFWGNMFISFIITFAAGHLCFEESLPENIMKMYRTLVFIICIFTWIVLSITSGIQDKWRYEVFTVLFWLIPPLVIYLANEGPEAFTMSITMYLLSEFFIIMFETPAKAVGEVLGIGSVPVMLEIVLICSFAFLAGNLCSEKLKKVITLI